MANNGPGLGFASVAADLMRCVAFYMAEAAASMQRREEHPQPVSSQAAMLASRNMLWVRVKTAAYGNVRSPNGCALALPAYRAQHGVLVDLSNLQRRLPLHSCVPDAQ